MKRGMFVHIFPHVYFLLSMRWVFLYLVLCLSGSSVYALFFPSTPQLNMVSECMYGNQKLKVKIWQLHTSIS